MTIWMAVIFESSASMRRVRSPVWMSHVTHTNESWCTFPIEVISKTDSKRATKYRALLRKMSCGALSELKWFLLMSCLISNLRWFVVMSCFNWMDENMTSLQPVPWKMRLEMLNQMVLEFLNGGEILVNCKFKLNKNLNLNLYARYLGIQIQSKSQFDFVPWDTERFDFLDFD